MRDTESRIVAVQIDREAVSDSRVLAVPIYGEAASDSRILAGQIHVGVTSHALHTMQDRGGPN